MFNGFYSGIFLPLVFLTGLSLIPDRQTSSNLDLADSQGDSQTSNQAPSVKILQPLKNARYSWNQLLPYSIEVSDPEDGESKYQEIQSAEVLVKLKYVENATRASAYLKQKVFADSAGVMSMVASNCFSCHAVKSKLAGPSYQEISLKYANTKVNRDLLVNHIKNGSRGIWGNEVMPTHPEIKDTIIRQMVKWILTYANDPGLNYFTGLQGIIPLKKTNPVNRGGIFIVMAFYTDHGNAEIPGKRITGSGYVTIQMKM
jgi:cytochrome c